MDGKTAQIIERDRHPLLPRGLNRTEEIKLLLKKWHRVFDGMSVRQIHNGQVEPGAGVPCADLSAQCFENPYVELRIRPLGSLKEAGPRPHWRRL